MRLTCLPSYILIPFSLLYDRICFDGLPTSGTKGVTSVQGRCRFIFVTLNSCIYSANVYEHLPCSLAEHGTQNTNKTQLNPVSVQCNWQQAGSSSIILKLRHKEKSEYDSPAGETA